MGSGDDEFRRNNPDHGKEKQLGWALADGAEASGERQWGGFFGGDSGYPAELIDLSGL